jgi:hypothetical protein
MIYIVNIFVHDALLVKIEDIASGSADGVTLLVVVLAITDGIVYQINHSTLNITNYNTASNKVSTNLSKVSCCSYLIIGVTNDNSKSKSPYNYLIIGVTNANSNSRY